ncbi:WD40-repeat-containing domain protein [Sporodiniella umbellata]|nr:WD40-repeat-containing domain protein [Sporodiniella umbellata]
MKREIGTNFIHYIRKQSSKELIIISSDEEDIDIVGEPSVDYRQRPSLSQPDNHLAKKRKLKDTIVIPDIQQEELNKSAPHSEDVFEDYSLNCEKLFEKQRISFIAMLDQVSQTYSMNNRFTLLEIDDKLKVKTERSSSLTTENEIIQVSKKEEDTMRMCREDSIQENIEHLRVPSISHQHTQKSLTLKGQEHLILEQPYKQPIPVHLDSIIPQSAHKNLSLQPDLQQSPTLDSLQLQNFKSKKEQELSLQYISDIPNIEPSTNIPTTVRINTFIHNQAEEKKSSIPNTLSTEELLSMLETYMLTLNGEAVIANEESLFSSRPAPRRAQRGTEIKELTVSTTNNYRELQKPYTPNKVWFNSTWEDWAQLNQGDILHVPFSKEEADLIKYHVQKHLARPARCQVDFWIYLSSMLPGRTRLDCLWFWIDLESGIPFAHTENVMVTKYKSIPRHKSRYGLLQKRRGNGYIVRHAMKQYQWTNMSKENQMSGGSGDAISVTIFQDESRDIRVAAGSLCDENVQYNMPGNLRLWNSTTKHTHTLYGHQTETPQAQQQNIWRTVADIKVSNEGGLFFSGSHDGTTKVWKQGTGRLVSTLQFHCKPVNQLAVDYWTSGNVLASCSNDGTATIWNIGESGKSGDGSICELDAPFYKDPAVECLEFGHHASKNCLFLGIYNRDTDHTGYKVHAFDSVTCRPLRHFGSILGGVSALSISSSGRYIVSGNYNRYDNLSGDKHLHLHDMSNAGTSIKFFTGHQDVNVVSISPCERFIASGSADKEVGEVAIFDIRFHTKTLHKLVHDQSKLNQSLIAPDSSIGIGGMYWMSDSRMVVTGGGDSSVKIWNVEGETKLIKTYQTTNSITSLDVNEDCMTIVAGAAGADGIVHIWQP